MKKLLFKNFLMMCAAMALVFGISRVALLILQKQNVTDPVVSYHITLISGALGLILFALLLYIFVGRRLKAVSLAVNNVKDGNLESKISIKGKDELSELAYDFNHMVDRLQSNEYLNREFVKNVSHEFKTPLSIILGYSDLLQSDALTAEEIKEYSTYINNEAKRLNSLSEKLLAISRLDSDNFVNTQQLFSADEQIRNIILSLQIVWTKNNLNFDAELPETYIRSNRDLCYLVWQNLISNAVKYTPVNGNISVKLSEEKNWLIFSITNTGNSLAGKEELIFQSFYTSDSSGKDKGTGLGLPLVKKILQKLGGDITVSCTDSTQFTVRLPLT